MSSTTKPAFAQDSWQTTKNARTLRAYMALRNQEIGDRIRELRGPRPQTTVAEAIGASPRTLQTWEGGVAKPNYRYLQRLAEYFGVTEGFILEGVDDRPVIEGVPEQLDGVDEKFSELVEAVQAQLGRLEAKVDRLMHLIDASLFVTRPEDEADEPDESRRHPEPLRTNTRPLGEILGEVLQATEALNALTTPKPARTARGRGSRRAAS